MNDEAKTEEEEVKKPKPMLIIIIAAVAVIAIGGGAAFFLLGSSGDAPAEGEEGAASPAAKRPGNEPGPLVNLGSFVVNVQVGDMTSYLKASLTVEIDRPESEEIITKSQPLIKNVVIMHLSSMDVEDARTIEQKMALQEKLKELINERLKSEIIMGVYFTDFVTQ